MASLQHASINQAIPLVFLAFSACAQATERTVLHAPVVHVKPLVEKTVETRPERRCEWMIPLPHDRRVRRCNTQEVTRTREVIRGYHVTYRLGDETFTARLDEHPGSTVLVNARITPIDDEAMQVAKNTQADDRPQP